MKIGLVSPYDLGLPGGVQDQVIRLAGWLREAGHEAVIVGPGTEGPDDAILLGATTVVPANQAKTPIRLDPRIGRQLAGALSGADVIHVHEPLMPAVSPAALRVAGPAKVATFHADPPQWVRRIYRHGRAGVRVAIRNARIVTAVSPVAGSSIEGVVDYRIIPNGIEVDAYGTGPKIAGRVAYLGRDDERKGLQVLLDAWPAVRAAVPAATLDVLGAQRDEHQAGVRFFGRVDDATKRSELAVASVFCAPNLGGESFGIVVAEAMASSCAIVASSIPAFEHVAGPSARFTRPGDVGEVAEQIIELLIESDEAAALGRDAVRRVRTFDGSVVARAYLDAYADAIEAG
jgi:phosphatidylinositol alpha-mannosyltransferase